MATFAEWAGGSRKITTAVDVQLGSMVRITQIEATAPGVEAALPDARRFGKGGPVLVVWNTGSESIDIVDKEGGAFKTLAENEMVACLLIDNSTAAGEWRGQVEATDALPTSGPNDFFFTVGGFEANGIPWQYDHGTDSWSAGSSSTNNISESAGVEAAGIGYIPSDTSPYQVQRYDPFSWSVLGNATATPANRSSCADLARGEFYGRFFGSTNAHDRYDTDLDSWSSGTNFPTNHKNGAAENIETGTIMVYGGDAGVFVANALNREHTVASDTFTSKTAMSQQRLKFGHFTIDEEVFAVCGSIDGNGPFLDVVESYTLAGDSWTSRQDWPDGLRWRGPAAAARAAGIGYAAGGEGSRAANSYQVDTWTAIADHGVASSGLRAAHNTSMALEVS